MYALLAAVATAEAVESFGFLRTSLKWPNDVLIGEAKLAGILVDATMVDDRVDWLVIGIGMNLAMAPEIDGRQTTSLAAQGVSVDPRDMADRLLPRLAAWSAADDALIRDTWLRRAHPVGTALTVRGTHDVTVGVFAGLSAAGELLLQCASGIKAIGTGEILLGQR